MHRASTIQSKFDRNIYLFYQSKFISSSTSSTSDSSPVASDEWVSCCCSDLDLLNDFPGGSLRISHPNLSDTALSSVPSGLFWSDFGIIQSGVFVFFKEKADKRFEMERSSVFSALSVILVVDVFIFAAKLEKEVDMLEEESFSDDVLSTALLPVATADVFILVAKLANDADIFDGASSFVDATVPSPTSVDFPLLSAALSRFAKLDNEFFAWSS